MEHQILIAWCHCGHPSTRSDPWCVGLGPLERILTKTLIAVKHLWAVLEETFHSPGAQVQVTAAQLASAQVTAQPSQNTRPCEFKDMILTKTSSFDSFVTWIYNDRFISFKWSHCWACSLAGSFKSIILTCLCGVHEVATHTNLSLEVRAFAKHTNVF